MNKQTILRMARESAMIAYRVRLLPEQLTRARHRVRQLESEARRLGMLDLLNDPDAPSRAFEAEIAQAYAQAAGE